MELLTKLHNTVLEMMEQDALNTFSTVADFRAYIETTRPASDVIVTLKLCCLSSERLAGCRGTRVTCIDKRKCIGFYETAESMGALDIPAFRARIAQVVVWDDIKPSTRQKPCIEFKPGAVYEFQRMEYVGLYDDVVSGTVQYDNENHDKIREIAPPIRGQCT
ncbi:hypothetical protein DVH05_008914 [Phytophthora capsici]|nr:hypothetical protein DVH05_008914 [Phytophthora capsici]